MLALSAPSRISCRTGTESTATALRSSMVRFRPCRLSPIFQGATRTYITRSIRTGPHALAPQADARSWWPVDRHPRPRAYGSRARSLPLGPWRAAGPVAKTPRPVWRETNGAQAGTSEVAGVPPGDTKSGCQARSGGQAKTYCQALREDRLERPPGGHHLALY